MAEGSESLPYIMDYTKSIVHRASYVQVREATIHFSPFMFGWFFFTFWGAMMMLIFSVGLIVKKPNFLCTFTHT